MISGKIYCLKSFQTDKIYIGSTSQKIKRRLQQHKSHYKRYLNGKMRYLSSFEIIKYNDCYIELIKEVACEKKQLLILEGQEINNNSKCINLFLCGKSSNDYGENYYKRRNEHILCSCGDMYSQSNKARHNNSNKHQNYLYSLIQ